MASQQATEELSARIATLEQFNLATTMPDPRGSECAILRKYCLLWKHTRIDDPQFQKLTVGDLIDTKLKMARAMSTVNNQDKRRHIVTDLYSKARLSETLVHWWMRSSIANGISK